MSTTATPLRVGIFSSIAAADQAVDGLLAADFTTDQISVVCSDELKERHFAEFHHQSPAGTTTPRNTAVGGAIGATLGGVAAILGSAATGGAGLLFAGGISAWAGGIVGGLIGAMSSRGVEKELANFYDQAVQDGKILVAADMEEEPDEAIQAKRLAQAEEILEAAGADPLPMREG